MWKRDEAVKPTAPAGPAQRRRHPVSAPPAAEAARTTAPASPSADMERTHVNIGKSSSSKAS